MTSVRRRRLRGMGEHYTHTVGRPLDRYVRLAVGYRYAGVRPAVQPSRWRVENDLAFVQDGSDDAMAASSA